MIALVLQFEDRFSPPRRRQRRIQAAPQPPPIEDVEPLRELYFEEEIEQQEGEPIDEQQEGQEQPDVGENEMQNRRGRVPSHEKMVNLVALLQQQYSISEIKLRINSIFNRGVVVSKKENNGQLLGKVK